MARKKKPLLHSFNFFQWWVKVISFRAPQRIIHCFMIRCSWLLSFEFFRCIETMLSYRKKKTCHIDTNFFCARRPKKKLNIGVRTINLLPRKFEKEYEPKCNMRPKRDNIASCKQTIKRTHCAILSENTQIVHFSSCQSRSSKSIVRLRDPRKVFKRHWIQKMQDPERRKFVWWASKRCHNRTCTSR